MLSLNANHIICVIYLFASYRGKELDYLSTWGIVQDRTYALDLARSCITLDRTSRRRLHLQYPSVSRVSGIANPKNSHT